MITQGLGAKTLSVTKAKVDVQSGTYFGPK